MAEGFIEAARSNNLDEVKRLLVNGIDPNICNDKGETALYWASHDGRLEIVKELLSAPDIDVNCKNIRDDTPLMHACYNGYLEIVKELLNAGANPNTIDEYKRTPFLLSCREGHLDIVKELIFYGADITIGDEFERTPLYWASYMENSEIVKVLMDLDGESDFNIDRRGMLIHLAHFGDYEVIENHFITLQGLCMRAIVTNKVNIIRMPRNLF